MWHDVTAFDTFLLQLLVLSTNLHLLVSFVESLKPVGKVSARWSRIAIASFQTRWMKRRSWTLQSSWNFWRVGELKVAATEVANNLVIRRSKNIYTVVIYIYSISFLNNHFLEVMLPCPRWEPVFGSPALAPIWICAAACTVWASVGRFSCHGWRWLGVRNSWPTVSQSEQP